MTTRRDIIKGGAGLAAILAAGKAPAYISSMWGARNALMTGKWLPYDAEVEYLESTGTQWIDTGVVPTDTTVVSLSADYTYTTTAYLFGAISTDYRTNCFGFSGNSDGSNAFRVFVSGSAIESINGNFGDARGGLSLQSCKLGANLCEIDSVNYPFAFPSYLPLGVTHPIYLCARNNKGTADYFAKMKVRGFAITTNSLLVRDFIPVRVGTTGALYDKRGVGGMNPDGSPRNDGMYFNRGTGNFGYGNDKN